MQNSKLKVDSKKIKQILKTTVWLLAERAFLSFILLFSLALIFTGVLYYKYSFLVEKEMPEINQKPIQFQEDTFREILKIWEERQKRFNEAELKEYPDLFK